MGEQGWLGSGLGGHCHPPCRRLSCIVVQPEHFIRWLASKSVHFQRVTMEASRPLKDQAENQHSITAFSGQARHRAARIQGEGRWTPSLDMGAASR